MTGFGGRVIAAVMGEWLSEPRLEFLPKTTVSLWGPGVVGHPLLGFVTAVLYADYTLFGGYAV